MLFNSYEFILVFLPLTVAVYFLIARLACESALAWLVLASLFFYAWWDPGYLVLIVASMMINYQVGRWLGMTGGMATFDRRAALAVGIMLNLGTLAYFKYAGFLADSVGQVTGMGLEVGDIVLPLAISFFTFQQIAYLVDAYKGIAREYSFLHYALFVTFFPQLIAGPIVHHREMLPQFQRPANLRPRLANVSVGMTIFAIGLFKKTVLADGIGAYATPVFDTAAAGGQPDLFMAWGGALAYTFQLYFDFSGYSDMAIGAARLFGIRLPLNFHSPYKATSIVEFWRRWHMTLSRFLRDYLYIPLGGNRHGRLNRYRNLMITMLLGGLWHGAGWTFVAWGGLHGLYLVINHAWGGLRRRLGGPLAVPSRLGRFLGWLLTFGAVVVGWVFFRAADFDAALAMLRGMAGLHGVSIPNAILVRLGPVREPLVDLGVGSYLGHGRQFIYTWLWVALVMPVALLAPNTQQLLRRYRPALSRHVTPAGAALGGGRAGRGLVWRPEPRWAMATGTLAAVGFLALTGVSEFLYFQF